MRHGKKVNHLGRQASHRNAMLSNMAISLIENKRITTTVAKAKALKKFVEPLVTKAKTDSTHSRRVVFSYLQSKEAVTALFGEIAEKIGSRPGGYTRIIKTGNRLGDAAETCLIELVDYNEIYVKEAKAGAKKTRRRGGSGATTSAPKVEKVEATEVQAVAAVEKVETTESAADDLKIVEGIGPKIAEILVAKGIVTFAQLAATSEETLKEILTEAGGVYASKDPSTWAKQAEMAANGQWDELKAWQDELNGGKETN
jgi:large subunit ribosomal protein L17